MQRALMWINLYGREAFSSKTGSKSVFWLFLSLCLTASWPYSLSHINVLRINQSYKPKDQFLEISKKNLRIGDFEKLIESATLIFFVLIPKKL